MSWLHIEDKKPKARKKHYCYLCGKTIDIGIIHIARTGIHTGEGFGTFRMHLDCEPHTHDWDIGDWECHDVSEFREMIETHRLP